MFIILRKSNMPDRQWEVHGPFDTTPEAQEYGRGISWNESDAKEFVIEQVIAPDWSMLETAEESGTEMMQPEQLAQMPPPGTPVLPGQDPTRR